MRRPLPLLLALALLGAGPGVVRTACGDDAPPAPAQPPAAPNPAAPAADPEAVAGRMSELFSRTAGDMPTVDPGASNEVRNTQIQRAKAWDSAVEALAKAADTYVQAAGDAPNPRALFWGGCGKSRRATRVPAADGVALHRSAVEMLTKCLELAPPDADYRAEAEFRLGSSMTFLFDSGGAPPSEAAARLRSATKAFLAAERNDEAGAAASVALKVLVARGLHDDARAFADAVGADRADFGRSTQVVRQLVARVRTAVGAAFPSLGETTDADGRKFAWKDLAGAPFVVHFFRAGWPTGRMAEERDVEMVLRPLHDKLSPKGLRMVGVSMDMLLDEATLERRRRYWDETGLKGAPHDGSAAAVRRWAESVGLTWPWLWTGKWTQDPVSLALGGAGQSAAHAILVDAGGVIRWRGDAPFTGLPEAAAGLLPK